MIGMQNLNTCHTHTELWWEVVVTVIFYKYRSPLNEAGDRPNHSSASVDRRHGPRSRVLPGMDTCALARSGEAVGLIWRKVKEVKNSFAEYRNEDDTSTKSITLQVGNL